MSRHLSSPVTSYPRNVHFWNDGGEYLGGLWQSTVNSHITKADFYELLGISCVFTSVNVSWAIWDANEDGSTGALLQRTQDLLPNGKYLILTPSGQAVQVIANPERPIRRVPTQQKSTEKLSSHESHFRQALRTRDGACAISGTGLTFPGNYVDKEAVHVFPVAKWQLWNQHGWPNVVTDSRPATEIGASKMYSTQNGLLLDVSIHRLFDHFHVGVNPDNGYKVFCFAEDTHNVGGRVLALSARQPTNGQDAVSDRLLRWHLRQCVFTNTKGAGEPRWEENDFGGHNEIEQIMALGDGSLRMEEELYNRLGPYMEVSA